MPVMSESEVVSQFLARRRRAIWFGGIPFALGIAIAFAAFGPFTFGLDTSQVFVIGWSIAMVSLIPLALIFRCPACGARIMSPSVFRGIAFDFSAEKCPRCGVSFRGSMTQ